MIRGEVTCRNILQAYAAGVREFNGIELVESPASRDSATLARSVLADAKFVSANLQNVDLSGADLSRAHFVDSSLRGANLSGARLVGSRITYSFLTGANLERADLSGIVIDRADFACVNLQSANLDDTFIYAVDLGEAKLGGISANQCVVYPMPVEDDEDVVEVLASAGARVLSIPDALPRITRRRRKAAFLSGRALASLPPSEDQLHSVPDLASFASNERAFKASYSEPLERNESPTVVTGRPLRLVFDPRVVPVSKVAAAIGVLEELLGGELRIVRVGSLPPKSGAISNSRIDATERSET